MAWRRIDGEGGGKGEMGEEGGMGRSGRAVARRGAEEKSCGPVAWTTNRMRGYSFQNAALSIWSARARMAAPGQSAKRVPGAAHSRISTLVGGWASMKRLLWLSLRRASWLGAAFDP